MANKQKGVHEPQNAIPANWQQAATVDGRGEAARETWPASSYNPVSRQFVKWSRNFIYLIRVHEHGYLVVFYGQDAVQQRRGWV